MDTANCYRQSDPLLNRQFRRRWHEHAPPAPRLAPAASGEPGTATLVRWVGEWRQRRSKEAPRPAEPRT